jgi:hypothetical protein
VHALIATGTPVVVVLLSGRPFALGSIVVEQATAASWLGLAVDIALIPVCVVGWEIGGLFLLPALVAFAITDLREPDRRKVPGGAPGNPNQRWSRRASSAGS